MRALEEKALEFGYRQLLLETRVQNVHAIRFYESCGYVRCDSYGVYQGKKNACCFSKNLTKERGLYT
ncbi:MAG: GNAT family N-acetyltransferase [Faecousia sp.]